MYTRQFSEELLIITRQTIEPEEMKMHKYVIR